MHKQLPHLIYFALATNYFNVFMSTTVLLGLRRLKKIGGQWIFGGASDFSNLLAPWASGSRSLMFRAGLSQTQSYDHSRPKSALLYRPFSTDRKEIGYKYDYMVMAIYPDVTVMNLLLTTSCVYILLQIV